MAKDMVIGITIDTSIFGIEIFIDRADTYGRQQHKQSHYSYARTVVTTAPLVPPYCSPNKEEENNTKGYK
jgi:hypothetical protein